MIPAALSSKFKHTSAPSQNRSSVPAQIMIPRLMVLFSVIALLAIGLVMVYSAGSIKGISSENGAEYYLIRQVGFVAFGTFVAFIVARVFNYHMWLGRWLIVAWLASTALLLCVPVFGTEALGAKRWVFGIQPSEFSKIVFLLVTAKFLFDWQQGRRDGRATAGCIFAAVIAPLLFLYKTQSDLGTTMICIVGILALLWLAEVPTRIVVGIVTVVVAFGLFSIFGTGYRSDRLIFLNPFADPYGDGYQLIHSFYAFAQGGILGKGLGNSAEKYLYLPEAQTDFVFSILGEELGLIGTLGVIALFLVFMVGGLRIAQNASDSHGQMIAGSFTVIIVFQAFLNMACVMGLFPTTGKPLPFLSYGGSSVISSIIMVGLILSVSFSSDDSKVYQKRREDLRLITSDRSGASGDQGERLPQDSGRPFGFGGGRASGSGRGRSSRSSGSGSPRSGSGRASGSGRDRSARSGSDRTRRSEGNAPSRSGGPRVVSRGDALSMSGARSSSRSSGGRGGSRGASVAYHERDTESQNRSARSSSQPRGASQLHLVTSYRGNGRG